MKNMNPMTLTIIVAVVVALVGGGVGFYVGKTSAQSRSTAGGQFGQNGQGRGGSRGQGGQNGTGANRFANRGTMGQVTAVDDKSLTVKMPDGSSKIVILSDSTMYEMSTKASKTDVVVGKSVRVLGNTNSDGSLTATYVMLNPQGFGPGMMGQGQNQGQGSQTQPQNQ